MIRHVLRNIAFQVSDLGLIFGQITFGEVGQDLSVRLSETIHNMRNLTCVVGNREDNELLLHDVWIITFMLIIIKEFSLLERLQPNILVTYTLLIEHYTNIVIFFFITVMKRCK